MLNASQCSPECVSLSSVWLPSEFLCVFVLLFSIQGEAKRQHWARWTGRIGPGCRVRNPVSTSFCFPFFGWVHRGFKDHSTLNLRPPVQASRTSANHSSAPLKQPVKKSGGCLWRGLRLLLILALLAAVFYYVYCHLLQREDNALDIQWSNRPAVKFQAPLVQWMLTVSLFLQNRDQTNNANMTIIVLALRS